MVQNKDCMMIACELRRRANRIWQDHREDRSDPGPGTRGSTGTELRVHQVELQLQNTELQRTRREEEESRDVPRLYESARGLLHSGKLWPPLEAIPLPESCSIRSKKVPSWPYHGFPSLVSFASEGEAEPRKILSSHLRLQKRGTCEIALNMGEKKDRLLRGRWYRGG